MTSRSRPCFRPLVVAILSGLLIAGCSLSHPTGERSEATPAAVGQPPTSPSAPPTTPPPPTPQSAGPQPSAAFTESTKLEPPGNRPAFRPAILFEGRNEQGRWSIYAVGPDLRTQVALLAVDMVDLDSVSTDGQWISYARRIGGHTDRVCVIPVTEGERSCFDFLTAVQYMEWRPRTHQLVVETDQGHFLIEPGSGKVPTSVAQMPDTHPLFTPDGNWTLWVGYKSEAHFVEDPKRIRIWEKVTFSHGSTAKRS